jgi:hypothetical protein
MPDLTIRIKKNPDGSAALTCTRADGTSTWQRQLGQQGRFFPFHDLTHYAVETVVGFRRGFYGLVAEGWDLTDFGKPWPRGPLPAEALLVEIIVGFLDGERAMGITRSAAELRDDVAIHCAQRGEGVGEYMITDAHLERVRATRGELFARWRAVIPGDALELDFDRAELSAGVPDTRSGQRAR